MPNNNNNNNNQEEVSKITWTERFAKIKEVNDKQNGENKKRLEEVCKNPRFIEELKRLLAYCLQDAYQSTDEQLNKDSWIVIDSIPKTIREAEYHLQRQLGSLRPMSEGNFKLKDHIALAKYSIMPEFSQFGIESEYKYRDSKNNTMLFREKEALVQGLKRIYNLEENDILINTNKQQEGYLTISLNKEKLKQKISAYINSSDELKSDLHEFIEKNTFSGDTTTFSSLDNVALDLFLGLWAANDKSPCLSELKHAVTGAPIYQIEVTREQLDNFVKLHPLVRNIANSEGKSEEPEHKRSKNNNSEGAFASKEAAKSQSGYTRT